MSSSSVWKREKEKEEEEEKEDEKSERKSGRNGREDLCESRKNEATIDRRAAAAERES